MRVEWHGQSAFTLTGGGAYEAEENGEPRRQHTEDASRTVAVVKVAAVRRPAPYQQHRPDGQRNGDENDHHVEQDV